MNKRFRTVSIIVLVSFIVNTPVYNTSFSFPAAGNAPEYTLSTSSIFNDLEGAQHKDIGRIKLGVEANLMRLAGVAEKIDIETLAKNASKYNPSIFDDTHFFFSEVKSLSKDTGYLGVMCRVKDTKTRDKDRRPIVRTYYAVFSPNLDAYGGFPVEVYTEEEWEGARRVIDRTNTLPLRELWKQEDAEAIKRYQEHETSVDEWIRRKMEEGGYAVNDIYNVPSEHSKHDKLYENAGYRYSWTDHIDIFRSPIRTRLENLGISTDDVEALLHVLVKKPLILLAKKKDENYPQVTMADKEGKSVSVEVHAHSSDNAVYIILDEETFSAITANSREPLHENELRRKGQPRIIHDLLADRKARKEVVDTCFYEAGVHLGLNGWVSDEGSLTNSLLEAEKVYNKDPEGYKPTDEILALEPVASLSEISKERDYAAAKRKKAAKKTPRKKAAKKTPQKAPAAINGSETKRRKLLDLYILYSEDVWKTIRDSEEAVTAGFLMRLVDSAFRDEMAKDFQESDIKDTVEEFIEEIEDVEADVLENALHVLRLMGMDRGNTEKSIVSGLMAILQAASEGKDFSGIRDLMIKKKRMDKDPPLSAIPVKIECIVHNKIGLFDQKRGYWAAQKIAKVIYSAYIDEIKEVVSGWQVKEHIEELIGSEPVKVEDIDRAEEILNDVCMTEGEKTYAKRVLSLSRVKMRQGKNVAEAIFSAVSAESITQAHKYGRFQKKPGRSDKDAIKVIALYDFMPERFTVGDYNRIYSKMRILYPYPELELSRLPVASPESQSRRDLDELVASGLLEKDVSGTPYVYELTDKGRNYVSDLRSYGAFRPKVSGEYLEGKITEVRASIGINPANGEHFMRDPRSALTQRAYEEIILIAEIIEDYDVVVSPETYAHICFARLFGPGDWRKVLDFFETVRLAPRESPMRRELLFNHQLVIAYFAARVMDTEGIKRVKELRPPESFLDYYWRELSGISPAPVVGGFQEGMVHRAIAPLVDIGETRMPAFRNPLWLDAVSDGISVMAGIYKIKGRSYKREGKTGKARDAYEKAIQLVDNITDIYEIEKPFSVGTYEYLDAFARFSYAKEKLIDEILQLGQDEGPSAAAQQDGPLTGEEANSAVSGMEPSGELYTDSEENKSLLKVYNDIEEAISMLSYGMAKGRKGTIITDEVGIIPVGEEDLPAKATYTLAVRIYPDNALRKIGVYQTFIEGVNRFRALMKSSDTQRVSSQGEVVRAMIQGSILHELGHGFEIYSGLDLYSMIYGEDAEELCRQFADISGYDFKNFETVKERRKFAEFIADLNMAGYGGEEYVKNKAACLFYKFVTANPRLYIEEREKLAKAVKGYYEESPHLNAALRHVITDKVTDEERMGKIVDEVLSCHELFFAEGTYGRDNWGDVFPPAEDDTSAVDTWSASISAGDLPAAEQQLIASLAGGTPGLEDADTIVHIALHGETVSEDVASEDKTDKLADPERIKTPAEMNSYAQEVGIEIAPPVKNYTIFTYGDMYIDEEDYRSDEAEYASRFHLERINPARADTVIRRILETIKEKQLNPKEVIVQLPIMFSEPENRSLAKELADKAPRIKLMLIDTTGLRGLDERKIHRSSIYSMMLLARKIDKDTSESSKLYMLLEYYLQGCINEAIVVDTYMKALKNPDGNWGTVFSVILRPVQKYSVPEYGIVSKTLLSA